MTDIVQKLRAARNDYDMAAAWSYADDAADEIERLRAENADAYGRGLEDGAALRKCVLPPGAWRVTVAADGTVERVPLRWTRMDLEDPTATRWADAPEQENDR